MHLLENLLLGWCPALAALILILGAGSLLLPARWLALPSPWPAALASALGWHLSALLILGLGVGFGIGAVRGLNQGCLLAGFWLPLAGLTAWSVWSGRFHAVFGFVGCLPRTCRLAGAWKPALALCILFFLLLAGIASAPPSKHDDLHYHLLLGHRGLIEGNWSFHASPYLLAAPHTAYQVMLTPLLAVGSPSSTGVFSLLWGVVLLLLVVERTRRVSPARAIAAAAVLFLAVGNAVWWVSPNPTSASALWSSVLFLWLFDRDELIAPGRLGQTAYSAGAALLASTLFSTKVSFLLPAGAAVMIVLLNTRRRFFFAGLTMATMAAVGAVTAGPWLLSCELSTGNPLGFAGEGVFGSSVFDHDSLRSALETSRSSNQILKWWSEAYYVNVLHTLAAVGLGIPVLVYRRRWDLLAVVLISSWLLALLVPHASRFHLFSLDGLLLAAVLGAPSSWIPGTVLRLAPVLVFLAGLPALAAAAWYSLLFWPAALGIQSPEEFLLERTALYEVWDWCNRETPAESRFCIDIGPLPRLFYLRRLALSPEGITIMERRDNGDISAFMRRYRLSYLVTQHPQPSEGGLILVREFAGVVVEAYRAPGRPPLRGTVWLYRIANERSSGNPSFDPLPEAERGRNWLLAPPLRFGEGDRKRGCLAAPPLRFGEGEGAGGRGFRTASANADSSTSGVQSVSLSPSRREVRP